MTNIDKFVAGFWSLISQSPWILTVAEVYPLSIYQPGIYSKGATSFFLVIPVIFVLTLTAFVVQCPRAIYLSFPAALVLGAGVWYIYDEFPADSDVHKYNWIASYCVLSIAAPALLRVYLDLRVHFSAQPPANNP